MNFSVSWLSGGSLCLAVPWHPNNYRERFVCLMGLNAASALFFAIPSKGRNPASLAFHLFTYFFGIWKALSKEKGIWVDSSALTAISRYQPADKTLSLSAAWQTLISGNVLPSSISRWASSIDLNSRPCH